MRTPQTQVTLLLTSLDSGPRKQCCHWSSSPRGVGRWIHWNWFLTNWKCEISWQNDKCESQRTSFRSQCSLSITWVPGTACGSCRCSNVQLYKEEHAYVHHVVTGLLQIIQRKQNFENYQIPSVPGPMDITMQTWRAVPFCPWTVLWMLNCLGGFSNSQ